MKSQFAAELTEGCRVDAQFAVRAKEMRMARTGDAYLAVELADRTGQLPGVWFRPSRELVSVPVGSVVTVRGTVTRYRGAKRISIDSLRPAETWDPSDLMAAGPRDESELIASFKALVSSVTDAGLSSMLHAVFGDREFLTRFRRCPGSQSYHHAYLGGLLEHTVAVADLCRSLGRTYPQADGDLLVTAALLHDVGKVDELEFDTAIEYTSEGRLLGHVVLGLRRLREAAARGHVLVSDDTLARLEHAMLSHHGELEWGSPKRPATLEALLLHHADNLDAKAAGFCSAIAGASIAEEVWTDASNLFRRPLYAPRAAEDERFSASLEDDQYYRTSA